MPIQNTGIDCPRNTTTVAAWSRSVLRRTALKIPTGTAIAIAMRSESDVSASVVGIRAVTSPNAGSL